ncbi:MAG: tRNA (adenosine(37)-N6)-threonylcarbamoyltransferase complex ATPase subunit type 1 TsaE [Betaproteobacteria bacterium]|nr:tRNA (adenosine(37)-N6)-threonylcarbamoyltransferase complex ATPase subunit type 1 TsaE [Betaproteobacteria bacterium]MDE2211988.1 tRNA (adenosine(37)-N6)-threonylcarbamoyltransferase complex ATPase subunit type 1 TsaE [Betaproteobacteria bacterium]MDE2624329.1 tRNA (adenosine(37)-N6)-threonylcarbamoyltransferase complex ATPase subunit type 1 TsaE [Betaproteobacteria bacterium]
MVGCRIDFFCHHGGPVSGPACNIQPTEYKVFFPDEPALEAWGRRFAPALKPGMLVTLQGDLGAGKTTLVRAVLKALGVTGRIKSPTYPLLETYNVSSLYLYHFDFYRIKGPFELEDAGFRECFAGPGLCFVEWPERAAGWLPAPDVTLTLRVEDAGRTLLAASGSDLGKECLERTFNA